MNYRNYLLIHSAHIRSWWFRLKQSSNLNKRNVLFFKYDKSEENEELED